MDWLACKCPPPVTSAGFDCTCLTLKALTSMFHWHLRFSLPEIRLLCKMSSDPSFLKLWLWLPSTCLCTGALWPPPVPLSSWEACLWAKDCHHLLWARAWISLHTSHLLIVMALYHQDWVFSALLRAPVAAHMVHTHPCLLFSPLWLPLAPWVPHSSLSLVCWLQPCPECSWAIRFAFQ